MLKQPDADGLWPCEECDARLRLTDVGAHNLWHWRNRPRTPCSDTCCNPPKETTDA